MTAMTDANVLVDVDWVRDHLDDNRVRIVEIGYEPDIDDYSDGHIPGALNWFWKDCYWDSSTREFVTPQQMAEWFGRAGIGPDTTVVLYSARSQYATYGYWVYHVLCGHPSIRVLDGGRRSWVAAKGPLTTDVPDVSPVDYPMPDDRVRNDSTRMLRDELLGKLGSPRLTILDGRYDEEYQGRRVKPGTGFDYGALQYGYIPGAVSMPFSELQRPDTFTFKSRAELEALFRAAGAAPDQVDEVVTYCRLGHRASMLWFVATVLLGWDHVRLYDGSWTEWGTCVGLPVARGEGTRVRS